jgi:SulP family sulfate permease
MPVGGSMSATSLNKQAGARTPLSLLIAAAVMLVTVLALGDVIAGIAMPAIAGLLIVIGYRTVKPADLYSVWRTGNVQKTVLTVTFVVTLILPLQFAVVVGVGLSIVLHTVRQSNKVTVRRRLYDADGHAVETDPPADLPANEVVVLQPYGSLFFAAASVFDVRSTRWVASWSSSPPTSASWSSSRSPAWRRRSAATTFTRATSGSAPPPGAR